MAGSLEVLTGAELWDESLAGASFPWAESVAGVAGVVPAFPVGGWLLWFCAVLPEGGPTDVGGAVDAPVLSEDVGTGDVAPALVSVGLPGAEFAGLSFVEVLAALFWSA